MAWWGKLLGGAFGYVFGGPLGALIGVALGHNLDGGLERTGEDFSSYLADETIDGKTWFSAQERTQTAFFTATFSVMGHLAKADGRVTRDELRIATEVMEQMSLTPDLTRAAQRLFNKGKAPGFPLDGVLEQFRQECHRSRNLIQLFIELQLHAAYADGALRPQERTILIHICHRLRISEFEFKRLEAMVQAELRFRRTVGAEDFRTQTGGTLDDAYAILKISPEASDHEVKRAYRRLMSQHHPDKLVANGVPEEMIRVATEKTQEIKLAYEQIKEARGL